MDQLAQKIADHIRATGPIPFISFMELALYCPVYGYYEKEEDRLGPSGDYYTSVNSGPLFGELLARQFADWTEALELDTDCEVHFVEAGAHNGTLAADILQWTQEHRPNLFQKLKYRILEPSDRRRGWQRRTLHRFADKVKWDVGPGALSGSQSGPGGGGIQGIIFSNELFDAMPVHRLAWNAGTKSWQEWGVDFDPTRRSFTWGVLKSPPPESALPREVPQELLAVLPDGFTIETCLAAQRWWAQAAAALDAGFLMTIDYGLEHLEFFSPERSNGTLRAYRRHRVTQDLLQDPGNQDLTAHVDFEALRQAGEAAGLKTTLYDTQAHFISGIAERVLNDLNPPPWTRASIRQLQTLTHPEHLGRAFRVLVQARQKSLR